MSGKTLFASLTITLFCIFSTIQAQDKTTQTIIRAQAPEYEFGTVTYGDWDAEPQAEEQMGVKVSRVVNREELPGGPWASGSIDDYMIQNKEIAIIVKAPNPTTPNETGTIIDAVWRNQMWDLLGAIAQMVEIDTQPHMVVYERVNIKPSTANQPPYLELLGRPVGIKNHETYKGVLVATMLKMEGDSPRVEVITQIINKTEKALELRPVDNVIWGEMPFFIGAYGIPNITRTVSLKTHWVTGLQDDFALTITNNISGHFDIVDSSGNNSILAYGGRSIQSNQVIEARRYIILSKGDMAPALEFILQKKKFLYGFMEGTVKQSADDKPIANARVEIRIVNPQAQGPMTILPFAVTYSNSEGKYRMPLPEGDFAPQSRTVDRPIMPEARQVLTVKANETSKCDLPQVVPVQFTFEVIDADTSRPIPAKATLERVTKVPYMMSPEWVAQGALDNYYLKPGANALSMLGGRYNCTFSHGPEYEVVQKQIDLIPTNPGSFKIPLKRVIPANQMVSVALDLATDASPESRSTPEDVVLAAAGEGVEWVVSGDLNKITSLKPAIEKMGLQDWIKASAGVRLSVQGKKMFGDFFVFPVPANTPKDVVEKLKAWDSTPEAFFKAVRKAFPKAIISVVNPLYANQGYFSFFKFNPEDLETPLDSFSMDFDAIEVSDTKEASIMKAQKDLVENMNRKGFFKFPLAVSRATSLFYQEPGYPRVYLYLEKNKPARVDDLKEELLADSLRNRAYFVTNGPIINQKIDGGIPKEIIKANNGEFDQQVSVLAAPWVKVQNVSILNKGQFGMGSIQSQIKESDNIKVFPSGKDPLLTKRWVLRNVDQKQNKEVFTDTFININVQGGNLTPVVSNPLNTSYWTFAFTPPLMIDADGDGKVTIGK